MRMIRKSRVAGEFCSRIHTRARWSPWARQVQSSQHFCEPSRIHVPGICMHTCYSQAENDGERDDDFATAAEPAVPQLLIMLRRRHELTHRTTSSILLHASRARVPAMHLHEPRNLGT